MRILFVCPSLPVPLTSGGAIRVFNLIRHLSAADEVDFLGMDDGSTPEAEIDRLRRHCAHVYVVVPRRLSALTNAARVTGRLLRGIPFYTKYVDRPEFRSRLVAVTRATPYDIIHVEHSHMAGLAGSICRKPGSRLVLSSENVAFDQFYRMFRQERRWTEKVKCLLTWIPMLTWETRAAAAFDEILTVTERDRDLYHAQDPELPITVVPNGVDTEAFRPAPREGREASLLMVGSLDYAPNVDAVLHFHDAILPLILRARPDCRLTIVGKNPPPAIRRIHRAGQVEVCPDVPDVSPFYGRAMLAPVALRAGGGSRLKILEALAHGLPVVSTAVGCEGLNVCPERDILVADTPPDFARRAVDVLARPELWQTLSSRGRALVQSRYDWKTIGAGLRAAYQACLGRPVARKETA